MFDKKQFDIALVSANMSRTGVARALNINTSTLYKKATGKSEWTLSEITRVGELVGKEKIATIFFAE